MNIINFLTKNKYKKWTVLAYIYSLEFSYKIRHCKDFNKYKAEWGKRGEESAHDEIMDNYYIARGISYCVNRICTKTKWESKCLVRALTAQRMLKEKNIRSTLHLGCRPDENENRLVAHAWIRVGQMYVTGGNGEDQGYAVTEKFLA